MASDFADLIERLRGRAAGAHPRATAQMIADAELELGFRLPRLLRAVYRLVGNGGFGPGVGHGLIGVPGTEPYLSAGDSVVDLYDRNVHFAADGDEWPEMMLPISDYGCASHACVDCSRRSARVLLFDADAYLGMREPNARRSFRPLSPTLAGWFEQWLDEPPG